jgi:uncharacterized membrane protein
MAEHNPNARLEFFCDGVFAIALTLLIIDVKIPPAVVIMSDTDFWLALTHTAPSIMAFVLSFIVIFITWVNHYSTMLLVNKTSGPFICANGLLLFSVVAIPFPTALLGDHLFTGHAAPAVILYNVVLALQAIGWIFLTETAIKGRLTKNAVSASAMRVNKRNGYFAVTLYSTLAVLAYWIPGTVAAITILTWLFWLWVGIYVMGKARLELA